MNLDFKNVSNESSEVQNLVSIILKYNNNAFHSIQEFQSAMLPLPMFSEMKTFLREYIQRAETDADLCTKGGLRYLSMFRWKVAQTHHESLDLPPFLVVTNATDAYDVMFNPIDRIMLAFMLSRLHFLLTRQWLPVVIYIYCEGHAMAEVWLPLGDNHWRATSIDSSAASNQSDLISSRLGIGQKQAKLGFQYSLLRLGEDYSLDELVEEYSCVVDFQGNTGTCYQWAFGLSLFLLYMWQEPPGREWCPNMSRLARLSVELNIRSTNAFIKAFNLALAHSLEAPDNSDLSLPQNILEQIRQVVLEWIQRMFQLYSGQQDEALFTLDEVQEDKWTAFLHTVVAAASEDYIEDKKRMIEMCVPEFIFEMDEVTRVRVCSKDKSCDHLLFIHRFPLKNVFEMDRFKMTAAITRFASIHKFGAPVEAIVLCKTADLSTGPVGIGLIVVKRFEEVTPSTSQIMIGNASKLMHDAGIIHGNVQPKNMVQHDGHVYFLDFKSALPFFASIPPQLRMIDLTGSGFTALTETDWEVVETWVRALSPEERQFIRDHWHMYAWSSFGDALDLYFN